MSKIKEIINNMFMDICRESTALQDKINNDHLHSEMELDAAFDKLQELNIRANQLYKVCCKIDKMESVPRETSTDK